MLAACGGQPAEVPVQHVSMKLTDSSSGFGLKLLDTLLSEKGAANVFISPLSATILLSMVASAAKGDTRAAMLTALGMDPSVDPSVEIAATIKRLAQSDSNAQFELAQAVWAQKGLGLSPAYVKKLREDYRAELANLDFQAPTSKRAQTLRSLARQLSPACRNYESRARPDPIHQIYRSSSSLATMFHWRVRFHLSSDTLNEFREGVARRRPGASHRETGPIYRQ